MSDKDLMLFADDIPVFNIRDLSVPMWDLPKRKIYGPSVDVRRSPKVNRNEACPCGSGKKNKKCCNLKTK